MELAAVELAKEWAAGSFRRVYYLVGEDAAGRAAAVSRLKELFGADAFNLAEFSGDPAAKVQAVVSECLTLPVFAARRLVVVHDADLPAAAKTALSAYLKDPSPATTLVLQSGDKRPDLKDPLVKAARAAGAVALFPALTEDQAARRLKAEAKKAGKTLDDDAAEALVAEVGADWGLLKQELEKAVLFAPGPTVGRDAVLETLGYRKAADPFALARLVQDRRLKEALAHLRRLFLEGKPSEQAFRALNQVGAVVSKQLKAKRLQRTGAAPEDIFRTLRLHHYWDRDFLSGLARLPEKRLAADLKACVETDAALKSRSWLDPKVELERLIARVCS